MRTAKDFIFRQYCVKDKYMSQEYEGAVVFDISADDDIIMQWTGLLDKNGKKIFEGDIINFKVDGFPKDTFRGIIRFNDASFLLHEETFADGCICDGLENDELISNFSDIEVIGNIYQNPELLERAE